MADKIRLGLIGASVRGTWSARSHLPALRASAGPRTSAAASGGWITKSPAVAPTERENETSQARSGSEAARRISEQANARAGGARRPSARASIAALSIAAARTADPLPPAKSA